MSVAIRAMIAAARRMPRRAHASASGAAMTVCAFGAPAADRGVRGRRRVRRRPDVMRGRRRGGGGGGGCAGGGWWRWAVLRGRLCSCASWALTGATTVAGAEVRC